MSGPWYQRFMSSTRGRLIAYLRRETHTVDELAAELHLTDNAVRAHLAALERDGLVQQSGVRRSGAVGKPAFAYELTDDAEQFFPKPYPLVLDELLDALDERIPPAEIEAVLRTVGNRISESFPAGRGNSRARLEAAAAAINELGGLANLEEQDGTLILQGHTCPLSAIIPKHPEACTLAEAFVSSVAGVPVRECCQRDTTPRCRFELAEQPPDTIGEP